MPHIEQFDDPLNPHGWAVEPALRRLRVCFPDLEWTIRPTVLVPSWDAYEGPEFDGGRGGAAATCARVSERSNMPIDEYLWFDDPPASSTVACRAVAAASESGGRAGARRVVRTLREATFLRRTNVDERRAVERVLSSVPDVDAGDVLAALSDGSAEAVLADHRQAASSLDVDGVQMVGDRPRLPTVVVRGEDDARGVSGRRHYGAFRGAVTGTTGLTEADERPGVEAVLNRFSPEGWVSATELSALVGAPQDEVSERAGELVAADEAVERSFAAEPFWRRPGFAGNDG